MASFLSFSDNDPNTFLAHGKRTWTEKRPMQHPRLPQSADLSIIEAVRDPLDRTEGSKSKEESPSGITIPDDYHKDI